MAPTPSSTNKTGPLKAGLCTSAIRWNKFVASPSIPRPWLVFLAVDPTVRTSHDLPANLLTPVRRTSDVRFDFHLEHHILSEMKW